jgi:UDP-glucose 4-epimerase
MGRIRALVTGGAGFIGSHMCDLLLANGIEVIALDNFSTGRPQNVAHHKENPNFRLIQGDITKKEEIYAHFEEIDWVFHFAALGDIVPSITHPEKYYHANVLGTLNVLESSRAHRIKKLVYAASSSCYGIPDRYPTPEEGEKDPQYPYALTKYLAEQTVLHWEKVYRLPAISLRFFNAYGPRSRTSGTYGAVFGVFLAQKLAGNPFTVVGDGNQTRDFTYVTDIAEACLAAAKSNRSGEVYNIGSGGTYSVNRLVELLGGDCVMIPKRPGEPDCTFADVQKVKRELGWEAKVSFEEGVARVVENIDYWREAPVWTVEAIAEETREWFSCLSNN